MSQLKRTTNCKEINRRPQENVGTEQFAARQEGLKDQPKGMLGKQNFEPTGQGNKARGKRKKKRVVGLFTEARNQRKKKKAV